jgi:xanthine dehydrogenase YagR molybdenum-binding subunit
MAVRELAGEATAQQSPLGTPVSRVDGRLKVTGGAPYASDNHVDRLAHGYLVLSTVARGTVRSMDTEAAERSPGVLAVYTPFRPLGLNETESLPIGPNWVPLRDTAVHHHGQVIGLVVAETFEQARDAAALVRATYDAQPPVASFEDNIPQATVAEEQFFGPTIVDRLAPGVASVDAALAAAEVTVSAAYSQPIKLHNPMEPHSTVAVWQGGSVTVYSGTQRATLHAQTIAQAVGVDPASVHVISPYVGGAFGNKAQTWGHTVLTVAAARDLGRPVRTVLTREQMFTATGHRSRVAQTVALGATRGGVLTAVKHEAHSSASALGGTPPHAPNSTTLALYRCDNIHAGQRVVTLDTPPAIIMRAPSEEPGAFALECAMDELAVQLRMDPIELRMKNYATVHPGSGQPFSSKHLDECYRVGAERFGWSRRNPVSGAVTDGDWQVGMGMATAFYPASRLPGQVRIRLQADGTATISTATADLGTGMWTVLTQLGADALGIPMDRITPEIGDSALPSNFGAVSSASTASVSTALRLAAGSAQRALIQTAVENPSSPFRGMNPQDVRYADGALAAADRTVGFGDLLQATGTPAVEATEGISFGADQQGLEFYSFGAHFCEVRVNRWTGEPRLSRFTTVVDAGQIINPKTATSQIVGGVIFGIGHALLESVRIESATGRFAGANLAEYLLPVNADVPPIDVHFVQYPDTAFNPDGVRGIGELGTVGSAAAIANAVFNATGRRVRDLPITLDKLL